MTEPRAVDVVFRIWQSDEMSTLLDPECAPLVERAMKLWTVERRDTWLTVSGSEGSECSILASTITSSVLSTAAQRAVATLRDKELDDERRENRRVAGFIE